MKVSPSLMVIISAGLFVAAVISVNRDRELHRLKAELEVLREYGSLQEYERRLKILRGEEKPWVAKDHSEFIQGMWACAVDHGTNQCPGYSVGTGVVHGVDTSMYREGEEISYPNRMSMTVIAGEDLPKGALVAPGTSQGYNAVVMALPADELDIDDWDRRPGITVSAAKMGEKVEMWFLSGR